MVSQLVLRHSGSCEQDCGFDVRESDSHDWFEDLSGAAWLLSACWLCGFIATVHMPRGSNSGDNFKV